MSGSWPNLFEVADAPQNPDETPLIERTELRDVRLVSVRAKNQERPIDEVHVHINMDRWAYKVESGVLLVKLRTEAIYSDQPGAPAENEDRKKHSILGRVVVVHLAELELKDDPDAISREDVEQLLQVNLLFMMYPYVRASLQRYTADLALPPIVLPYLRRDVSTHISPDSAPQVDAEETS